MSEFHVTTGDGFQVTEIHLDLDACLIDLLRCWFLRFHAGEYGSIVQYSGQVVATLVPVLSKRGEQVHTAIVHLTRYDGLTPQSQFWRVIDDGTDEPPEPCQISEDAFLGQAVA